MTCPRVTWKVRSVLFFKRDGEGKDALEFAFPFIDARSRFIAVTSFSRAQIRLLYSNLLLAALVIKEREREEGKKR